MRVFAASLATETNTFSPIFTDRSGFETAFYCPPGTHPDTPTLCSGPMVAARRRAKTDGFTLIEGTATWAEPAGLISREAYESLRDEILDQLRAAMPVDIVIYGLHGAMVARGYDDPEGDLLARTREIVGPDVVIGAELDMHHHLTRLRVDSADILVAFKEFPHTDFLARAEDLMELCLRAARGEIHPVTEVFDMRSLVSSFMTSREPGRSFVDRLLAMEGKDGILSISVTHGFTPADVPDVGCKVFVVADGEANRGKAKALAESLGREILAWPPGSSSPPHFKPAEAVAQALREPSQPIVFADRWDSPGGGVAGDSSVMVRELLAHPEIPSAIGALWDPVAVQFCRAAGAGETIRLRFCGKVAETSGTPIDAHVFIKAVSDDLLIPFEQSWVSLGPAAAISIGNVDIVLVTGRAQTFSPPAFTNLGIDLGQKKMVVVKSSNHFYAAFSKIAAAIHYLDTGGAFPSDPRKIAYTKLRRPIAPLDRNPLL
ncbi:M81 family metallopeptidase [Devosia sp. SD17-2]|uniref:M81 family metallopeptidase n=1 Tax=Devosia sp. SD17-2 TaxID=2976459 RepID=UPI0023D7F279|nr:M81 family metallopeptidase [Devosia sp. SD17-2]WEJ34036.1 M81 family metallopeptidase [Devosia sp. SD17-2]